MVLIRAKQVRDRVKELPLLIEQYKLNHPKKERNYSSYEIHFNRRLKEAIKNLDSFSLLLKCKYSILNIKVKMRINILFL